MAALIIPWNPDDQQWNGPYAADVDAVRRDGVIRRPWTLPAHLASPHRGASHPVAERGMDVWLVILIGPQAGQGLIGHGTLCAVGAPGDGPTPVEIEFDALLPHGDQAALPQLVERVPGLRAADAGPVVIGAADDAALRTAWRECVVPDAGSVDPAPGSLPPAARKRIDVDRFERDPDARRAVVAHHGSACHACGLDFEQRYGLDGGDLVHLHHVTPPEYIGADYDVDPLVDLVPLCPTCHVVAHSRWPRPYVIGELREMLARSGFLRGTVLTEEQLAAEAAAARILETSSEPDER